MSTETTESKKETRKLPQTPNTTVQQVHVQNLDLPLTQSVNLTIEVTEETIPKIIETSENPIAKKTNSIANIMNQLKQQPATESSRHQVTDIPVKKEKSQAFLDRQKMLSGVLDKKKDEHTENKDSNASTNGDKPKPGKLNPPPMIQSSTVLESATPRPPDNSGPMKRGGPPVGIGRGTPPQRGGRGGMPPKKPYRETASASKLVTSEDASPNTSSEIISSTPKKQPNSEQQKGPAISLDDIINKTLRHSTRIEKPQNTANSNNFENLTPRQIMDLMKKKSAQLSPQSGAQNNSVKRSVNIKTESTLNNISPKNNSTQQAKSILPIDQIETPTKIIEQNAETTISSLETEVPSTHILNTLNSNEKIELTPKFEEEPSNSNSDEHGTKDKVANSAIDHIETPEEIIQSTPIQNLWIVQKLEGDYSIGKENCDMFNFSSLDNLNPFIKGISSKPACQEIAKAIKKYSGDTPNIKLLYDDLLIIEFTSICPDFLKSLWENKYSAALCKSDEGITLFTIQNQGDTPDQIERFVNDHGGDLKQLYKEEDMQLPKAQETNENKEDKSSLTTAAQAGKLGIITQITNEEIKQNEEKQKKEEPKIPEKKESSFFSNWW